MAYPYPFQLLKNAGVKVLVHVFAFDSVVGGLGLGVDGGIEVLEGVGELHANFEGVGHICGASVPAVLI